jgi:hypothetical protein
MPKPATAADPMVKPEPNLERRGYHGCHAPQPARRRPQADPMKSGAVLVGVIDRGRHCKGMRDLTRWQALE